MNRNIILPAAMIGGIVLSGYLAVLHPATPYMIFLMLIITYCRISLREIRFTPLLFWLLAIQLIAGTGIFFLLKPLSEVASEGIMICVFAPTAVSSVVIAGMLGANVATVISYSLLSNMAVALTAPVLFSLSAANTDVVFFDSFLTILAKVAPLLLLPVLISAGLRRFLSRAGNWLAEHQNISFYIWALSLAIVTAQTVEFIKLQPPASYRIELLIACGALAVCIAQFYMGRWVGGRYGDTVAGGQSLGQKNTVLAIWMSQTFLDPVSSIGPASYVIWQNIVNSWQLWRAGRK